MSACCCIVRSFTHLENRTSKTLTSALSSGQPKPNDELLVPTPYPHDATEDPIEMIEQVDIDIGVMESIDVDALDENVNMSQSFTMSDYGCSRYRLTFPAGKSPYSAYPFGLHDVRPLPWKSTLVDDTMTIFSRGCTGQSHVGGGKCRPCQQLPENKNMEGILTRLEVGLHPNAPYAYHGIGSLLEIIRQKNSKIDYYRLRGLNQARKLLGKAAALTEHKRLLMAISSGDVKRVDRVISIGLHQKKGVRGLLASVMAAAQGRYNPRSYTEEEDMYFLLIWRLSGTVLLGSTTARDLGQVSRTSEPVPLFPHFFLPLESQQ